MANLILQLDLTPVYLAQNAVMEAALARLSAAVESVAINGAADWKTAVYKAKLWSGERERYADSINWRMITPLKAEITADYRLADQIEDGRPAYDMKQMLHSSTKVRQNKKGQRYLIIPFRHNTPGNTAHASAMPDHVYTMAKKLKASSITGMGTRASGTGALDIHTKQPLQVAQAKYLWGGRLAPGAMGPNPKKKSDHFAGMVRFDTSAKGSKAKSSSYVTFRIMSETSSGWVIAPRPGLKLAEGVTTKLLPMAQADFLAAIKGQF